MAVPPFNIAETTPADADFVRLFPAAERLFRDIVESWLILEHDATTGRHKIPVATAAALASLSFTTGSIRYVSDLQVFQVNIGGGVWDTVSLQLGQSLLLRNSGAIAPPGFIKGVLGNRYAAVISDETPAVVDGGTTSFTTAFANRTIAQANLPNVNFALSATSGFQSVNHTHFFSGTTSIAGNHNHTPSNGTSFITTSTVGAGVGGITSQTFDADPVTNTTGDHSHTVSGNTGIESLSHNHTITGTAASGGSGTALDFNVLRLGFNLYTRIAP